MKVMVIQIIHSQDIFVQTAGNRSMLANDYTQVNDPGYGLFRNNAALTNKLVHLHITTTQRSLVITVQKLEL